MIVITGATGNVGRPLVQTLSAAGEDVVAVSRHAAPSGNTDPNVSHFAADLNSPESLAPVLDGAKAIFLLTPPDFLAGGNLHEVLEVVRGAGVPRVVFLSSQGVGTQRHPSVFEDAVTGSGLEWTILRPGNFASNAYAWADSIRTQRAMAAPFADVALPVVDPQDIAEVAAAALLESGHANAVYTLTGPAAITPRRQAEIIQEVIGTPIAFTELTRDQARAGILTHMPEPVVETTLSILGSPTPAEQAVSPDAEKVLRRPPHTFDDWVTRNLQAFR
ncbi:NAD(P)H-binding protein [Kribbella sp. NPDC048915]|uniref:NAD(P)H-binding protein n=1 Tax=Kribbella sp. NPDC048915 TaxID=3155148 RepID=UPI0033E06B26